MLDPKIAIRNETTLVCESKLYELLRFCANQSLIEEVKYTALDYI